MSDASMQTAATVDNLDNCGKNDKKIVGNISMALDTFKDMIPIPPKGDFRYELRGVHLGKGVAKGKTKDDIYRACLFWAQKEEDVRANVFNVSKAIRRFHIFAGMQEKHYSETGWLKNPVYFSEIVLTQKYFPIGASPEPLKGTPTHKSLDGCMLWWFDAWKINHTQPGCNEAKLFRTHWYLALSSIFNKVTQRRGVVVVNNCKESWKENRAADSMFVGFEEHLIMDIFHGCFPIKFKKVICVHSPWWNTASIWFIKLFLSRKMRSRLKVYSTRKMHSQIGGNQLPHLPRSFLVY